MKLLRLVPILIHLHFLRTSILRSEIREEETLLICICSICVRVCCVHQSAHIMMSTIPMCKMRIETFIEVIVIYSKLVFDPTVDGICGHMRQKQTGCTISVRLQRVERQVR